MESLAKAETDPDDPVRPEPAVYVGAAACKRCHGDIFRAQTTSRHARTFARAKELGDLPIPARPFAIRSNQRSRTPSNAPEMLCMWKRARRQTLSRRGGIRPRIGTSRPVVRCADDKNSPRVLRMSLYLDRLTWDLTSHATPRPKDSREYLGRALNEAFLIQCLTCHVTTPRAAHDPAAIEARDLGIGCERCHGPGGNHLKAVELNFTELAIGRPARAEPASITKLCAQCHTPDDPDMTPDDPRFVRFQTTSLIRSRCYNESDVPLSCLTCHDPHRDAERSPSFYEAKCLSCHGTTARSTDAPAAPSPSKPRTTCPVDPAKGCVKCHMPTSADAAPHALFTDHYIRVPR